MRERGELKRRSESEHVRGSIPSAAYYPSLRRLRLGLL